MKKGCCIFLVLVLCLSLLGCGSNTNSTGFSSPEAVVEAFCRAMKAQDLRGMLNCFHIEPYMENYSFKDTAVQFGYYAPGGAVTPNQYTFFKDIQRQQMEGSYIYYIQVMIYTLLQTDYTYMDLLGMIQTEDMESWAEKFAEAVDPEQLEALNVLQISDAWSFLTEERRNQLKSYVLEYADDGTEMIALLELNGDYFAKNFRLTEYSGKWYISGLNSSINSLEMDPGCLQLENKAAFEELLQSIS